MITQSDKVEFKQIFGTPIERFKSQLSMVIPFEESGIDIIKFDLWVNPDQVDGRSCADVIREKYGESAVKLIERVL